MLGTLDCQPRSNSILHPWLRPSHWLLVLNNQHLNIGPALALMLVLVLVLRRWSRTGSKVAPDSSKRNPLSKNSQWHIHIPPFSLILTVSPLFFKHWLLFTLRVTFPSHGSSPMACSYGVFSYNSRCAWPFVSTLFSSSFLLFPRLSVLSHSTLRNVTLPFQNRVQKNLRSVSGLVFVLFIQLTVGS